MKIKDLERTANVAWSPINVHPIYLASGTAAQQLDASFNTNACLELYTLNLNDPGSDLQLCGSITSDQRFHKLVWGHHKSEDSGSIVAGCDNGIIKIYNPAKLLRNENSLVAQQEKHTGPVHSLDFNLFQHNLLASGAAESEIYIWDLNNMKNAMTPGAKSQPPEDVLCIEWNRQVQHILASTFSTKCVVWDLRKNEPIIKLTDTVSRIRWKVVAWHPEVATQLCLASEEDQAPIVQLWDLRFATSPLKTLAGQHKSGILAMRWCRQDADLLLTAGKDNRLICWNPNAPTSGTGANLQQDGSQGEVLGEVARTNQWCFDVAWCERSPALVACPTYDGHVSVYSLMGGKTQQVQTTNKIADSFPGMDGYAQAPVLQDQQTSGVPTSSDLIKAPKWMRRPVGASFGFGGKLISFDYDKQALAQANHNLQPGEIPTPISRRVSISQIITETELIYMSNQLEQALEYGNFTEYCRSKADSTSDQHKRYIWHFLKANFEDDYRTELLNLLGYNPDDVNTKLYEHIGANNMKNSVDKMDNLTDQFSNLNRPGDSIPDQFPNIPQPFELKKSIASFKIQTGDDLDGLITQAILLGNIDAATDLCLKAKRYADALVIAKTGGSQLFEQTQNKYLQQTDSSHISSLILSLVSEDWSIVIANCNVSSWKEALVAAISHTSNTELPRLCEQMGNRLEQEGVKNSQYLLDAQLCYICAGSFEKLVGSWSGRLSSSTKDLQELVELVTFLQKAVEKQGRNVEISGNLASLLSTYASLLASQGSLNTALSYLSNCSGQTLNGQLQELRDRLYVSLGQKPLQTQIASRSRHGTTNSRSSFSAYPSQFANAGGSGRYGTTPPPANMPLTPTATGMFSNRGSIGDAAPMPSWQTNATGGGLGGGSMFGGPLPPMPTANAPMPTMLQPIQPPTMQTSSFGPPPLPGGSSVPQQLPPPRPGSVGPNQGSALQSRSKYILDPSVQSNNPYAIPSLTRPYNPAPISQPSTYPTAPVPFQPQNTGSLYSNNNPLQPPLPPMQQHQQQHQPFYPGQQLNGGVPFGGHHEEQLPSPPPPTSNLPGWNDPPAFSRKVPSKPEPLAQQSPVTHPIFGTAPIINNGYPGGMPGAMGAPPMTPFDPAHQQQQAPPPPMVSLSSHTYGNMNTPIGGGFMQPPLQQHQPSLSTMCYDRAEEAMSPPIQRPPKEPTPKEPIPEEHKHLQTVLDDLRLRCSQAASNPQTKRKIDEVSRKLEALYDLLREHRLSPNTMTQLHDLVKHVQYGDYSAGLNIHMQMVSGPDFSQIASFMPGLKVLLQCAMQLQVFLN